MSYVVESGSSQRSRKRRRTALTLLVAVALLAMAFYYASTYFKKGVPAAAACPTVSAAAGAATATTTGTAAPPGSVPAPGKITVNIYNATGRNGLAADTAKQVKDRGFVVGTVANDPQRKSIAGPAEVRFGKNGDAASKVVMALVQGATPVGDARADASVDLVLGSGFKTLVAAQAATPGATSGIGAATGGSATGC